MIKLLFSFFLLTTLLSSKNIISCGNENSNKIYLTFDDGYSYQNTQTILDILKEKNVKVTFFLEGGFLDTNYTLVERMAKEGHIVGNHTWSHQNINYLTNNELKSEILRFENRYKEITNKNLTKVFRPPMGFINSQKTDFINKLGYKIFLWNVDYKDYNRYLDKGPDYAYNMIVNQVSNGSIILMHTLIDSNAKALPAIIDKLKRNYTFSTLEDFL